MSGKRGPRRSSFRPISGLVGEQVDVIGDQHQVAGVKSRLMPPAELLTISVRTPNCFMKAVGYATVRMSWPS